MYLFVIIGNCGFSSVLNLPLRHFINRPVYKDEINNRLKFMITKTTQQRMTWHLCITCHFHTLQQLLYNFIFLKLCIPNTYILGM